MPIPSSHKQKINGYYFITDSGLSITGNASDVEKAVSCGVGVVQYRNKQATTRQMIDEARVLRALCQNVLFLVNDRVDIALASGADGVHLGQDDMPYAMARKLLGDGAVIGVTVHTVEEALQAQRHKADYIGVSPIYLTSTKIDAGLASGPELIRSIKTNVTLPVIAIGGITHANAREVIDAGADGLCAISAVVCSDDVEKAINRFQKLFPPPINKK